MKNKYIKLFVLLISVVVLSGCVNVGHDSVDSIIAYVINNSNNMTNKVNRGFKYYIPRGLSITYKTDFNEIIKSNNYDYYLYVDLISYYNKIETKYEVDENAYYSQVINDKGLITITKNDNKYLIDLNYNYATMQVMVKEKDINMAVSNMMIITSSISYNDDTIRAMFDEGVLSTNEKPVSIFKNVDENNKELLELDEEFYYEEQKDRDFIK